MSDLKRTLGLSTAFATVVGTVIGSGIFFMPYEIFSTTKAPGFGLMIWAIAGFITIAAGLTVAELSAAIPKTGGMMAWLETTFGKTPAFLLGWTQAVVYFPALLAIMGLVSAGFIIELLGYGNKLVIAISLISYFAFLNCLSPKVSGRLLSVITLVKLIPILTLILIGFIYAPEGRESVSSFTPLFAEGSSFNSLILVFGVALTSALFAFDGWIFVGNIAGEIKKPHIYLPVAIVGGIGFITFVYLSINASLLSQLSYEGVVASKSPATAMAKAVYGDWGGKAITIGMILSVLGTLNALIVTGSRIPYAMANDLAFPGAQKLKKLSKSGLPVYGVIFIAVIGAGYALTGQYGHLANMTTFTIWIFYVLNFLAVIKLRKTQPKLERPYKVPLYPLFPVVSILGGVFIMVSTVISMPGYSAASLLILLLGFIVYKKYK